MYHILNKIRIRFSDPIQVEDKIRASGLNEIAKILAEQIKTVKGVASSQVIPVLKLWKDEMASQGPPLVIE